MFNGHLQVNVVGRIGRSCLDLEVARGTRAARTEPPKLKCKDRRDLQRMGLCIGDHGLIDIL